MSQRASIVASPPAFSPEIFARLVELETALGQVKQLKGLLPICGYCKKIRDDRNYWQNVETYVAAHSDARFTHGICPTCWTDVVEPQLAAEGIEQR